MNNTEDNKLDDFEDIVTQITNVLANYNNRNVDDYNKLVDVCERLESELDRVNGELDRCKKDVNEYRKLYDTLKAKGTDRTITELQHRLKSIELLVEKYNITLKDDLGRFDHMVLHYYDDNTDDDQVYCTIDSIHYGVLNYRDKVRNGFPIEEIRPIDIELVITYNTGICLQVLFSKFGNFVIPQFSEGKPYGITKEIIVALEMKRDLFFKALPNNKVIKRINILKSINIDTIYSEEECKLLHRNDIDSLYDVTNYLSNLDITLLNEFTSDIRDNIVRKAIEYLDTKVFI